MLEEKRDDSNQQFTFATEYKCKAIQKVEITCF